VHLTGRRKETAAQNALTGPITARVSSMSSRSTPPAPTDRLPPPAVAPVIAPSLPELAWTRWIDLARSLPDSTRYISLPASPSFTTMRPAPRNV
jgi:hypothetical protein